MSNKCIDCKFHKIVSDPDPHDWFNDDDVAMLYTKLPPDNNSTFYGGGKTPYFMISGSLRPYEISKVEIPKECPL